MRGSQPIKVGFIGCGGHAGRHAEVMYPSIENGDTFQIVNAYDPDVNTLYLFAGSYMEDHPYVAKSIDEFFATDGMEAVVICTPHKYHLELCQQAVRAGKHIFCEKPLWEGSFEAEGAAVIREAEKRGLVFSSCHLRRYEPEYLHLRSIQHELYSLIGKALEFRFNFFYHEPSTGWKMDDSLLLDHMNHEIDLLHFLYGHGEEEFWRLSHSHDEYQVAGKTESGLGVWFSGYRRLMTRVFRNELEVVHEGGRVRVVSILHSDTGIVHAQTVLEDFDDNNCNSISHQPRHYSESIRLVMQNFARAIRDEEELYLSPKDLITNTSICNALIASDRASI